MRLSRLWAVGVGSMATAVVLVLPSASFAAGATPRHLPHPVAGSTAASQVVQLVASVNDTCELLSNGTASCWGGNYYGELGNGTTTTATHPIPVKGLRGAKQIAVAFGHTCALLANKTVKCWGWNNNGQLGNGTATSTTVPVGVKGLSGVKQVAVGFSHSCALLLNGTVKCWGWGLYGQLGDGSTGYRHHPTLIKGLSGVRQIALGYAHTCAVLLTGAVRCWGSNSNGQLGTGTKVTQRDVPVAVKGIGDAQQIALGESHTCAVLSSGSVKCWGWGHYGQLGDGRLADSHIPVMVTGLPPATVVTVGAGDSCALLVTQTIKCWGYNHLGQLGDGTIVNRSRPVSTRRLAAVVQLTAGDDDTCALVQTLQYSCWGGNTHGELGNGTFKNVRTAPFVPSAPLKVTASLRDLSVLVRWRPPVSDGGSTVTRFVARANGGAPMCVTTAHFCSVTGLVDGTSYTFTVTALNRYGPSAASAASSAVVPSTKPGAPTAVSGAFGDTSVHVTWSAPASNGGSAITGYTVTAADSTTPANGYETCSWTTGPLGCTVTALTNGDSYTFTVAATNKAGTGPASSASGAIVPAAKPGAPTSVAATFGDASAHVTWSAPASNGGSAITGYIVTAADSTTPANGNETCSWSSGPLTCTVTALTNGDSYTFTVTATNKAGTGSASSASGAVVPATKPGVPTTVVGTFGDTSADVTWSAPASNGGSAITGYTVTAADSTTPANGHETCTWTTGPLGCTVTSLTNGDSYTFTVTATNKAGTGSASSASSVVVPATKPGAPTSVVATFGDTSAHVTWSAPASNGGSAITGYTVTATDSTTPANGHETCSWSSGPLTCTVTALTNGDSYTFTVTATNKAGTGPASSASSAVVPAAKPGAPTSVSGTFGDTSADVTWSAPASDGGSAITGYTVTAADSTTPANGHETCSWSSGPLTCPVTALTNGDSYTFTVTATNKAGTGSASSASSAVVPAAKPGAPTSVAATFGDTSADVTWSAPASDGGSAITGYTVTAADSTTPANGNETCTWTSGPLMCTVTSLTNGDSYTFTVTATNKAGTGPGSSASSAITPGPSLILSGGSYGFDGPGAVVSDGANLWVTNASGNSVTEFKASDGSWIQTLSDVSYGFDSPGAIAFDGTDLWVTNSAGNSVTEIKASDGSLVRVLTDVSYGFDSPGAIAFAGTHLWVTNAAGNSVTEFKASDGSLVQVLSDVSYGFDSPGAIAFDGTDLWATNSAGNSVTEFKASDGSLVQVLTDVSYGFDSPGAITFGGTHLWVTNAAGNSVTEFKASDGSLVQLLSDVSYGFDSPGAIAFDGTNLWVTNAAGNSVTEISASDGSLVQVLSDVSYGFDSPVAIAFDGTNLWVTNAAGNSVTGIADL